MTRTVPRWGRYLLQQLITLAVLGMVLLPPRAMGSPMLAAPAQTRIEAADGAASDNFGNAVALDGDLMAVGAVYADVGGVANAVVMFAPLGGPARPKPARLILDDVGCAFVPHVQVAPIGSELLLKNSDPILHTVHARLGSATLFNVGLPRWRQITKLLDRPGPVRIDCDVLHTWMTAVIMVVETPFFAVTDSAGRFAIDALPPAEYKMTIWHERLGAQTRIVSTEASANFEMIFRTAKLR